jgi:16S rRNA (uracil1498-N3)-methyltransferase
LKRIFFDGDASGLFTLEGDYFHYLKNVVRAKEGEKLEVMTKNSLVLCEIAELSKRSAELRVIESRELVSPDYKLKVYQCLLKREYMDFAVEKYAELGATEIVPVISSRSLKELKDKTKARFKDIVLKAVLQSENEHIPTVHDAVDINDVSADMSSNVIFYERCEDKAAPSVSKEMSIIIGPEGGFSDEEYTLLTSKGFQPVRPVRQILKAETASAVFTGYIRIMQETL